MGHHPFPAGRRSDNGQEQMRINVGIIVHHLHLRHASAQVGEHTQEEHIALTLVFRHFYPFGQECGQGVENPVGQEGGCQAHFAIAGTRFLLQVFHLFRSGEGCT